MRLVSMTLLFLPVLAQADLCKSKPINEPGLEERSFQIQFSDGRKVTVIGHDHGSTDKLEGVRDLVKNRSTTNSDYSSQIRQLVFADPATVQHAEADLKYLRKQVNTGAVSYIGVEYPDDEVGPRIARAAQLRKDSAQEYTRRKIKDLDAGRTTLAAYGAVATAKASDDKSFKSIPVVGLEDRSQMSIAGMYQGQFKKDCGSALKTIPKSNPYHAKFVDQLQGLKDNYHEVSSIGGAQVRKVLADSAPTEYRASVEACLDSAVGYLKKQRERDGTMVSSLLKRDGSGVLFVGQSHLDSLEQLLIEKCNGGGAPIVRPAAAAVRN